MQLPLTWTVKEKKKNATLILMKPSHPETHTSSLRYGMRLCGPGFHPMQ